MTMAVGLPESGWGTTGRDVTRLGHYIYVEALAGVAAQAADPRLGHLVGELRSPLRVGVAGRAGTGCSTVIRALRRGAVTVVAAGEARDVEVDVEVYVFTETLKPEDVAALSGSGPPRVAVLNKADLCGFGGAGPLARAASRCRTLQAQSGVPTVALAALIAAADVDDDTVAALRVLAAEPADLGSTDRFVAGPHLLSPAVRERLLAELDLFGIAHGVLAVRRGADRAGVTAELNRVSGAQEVFAAIERAAAALRYRRVAAALPLLAELSAGPDGARVAELLAGDEVVIARMAAAADVVAAAGMTVEAADSGPAHLRRAVRWQRYAMGPLSPLHRMCAADIARGSLRLWARDGGAGETLR